MSGGYGDDSKEEEDGWMDGIKKLMAMRRRGVVTRENECENPRPQKQNKR